MEKCTFCVQRIRARRDHARAIEHRAIRAGEVVTACQQACPTRRDPVRLARTHRGRRWSRWRERAAQLRRAPRARHRPRTQLPRARSRTRTRRCRDERCASRVLVGRPTRRRALRRSCSSTAWRPRRRLGRLGFAIAGARHAARSSSLITLHRARPASASGATTSRSPGRFGIINFVWWIGIGHAGTFISAILLLLEQRWRTSINRFAEAMTLFAVHAGRRCSRSSTSAGRGSPTGSFPYPSHDGRLAAVPERAAVGRGRDHHVLHGLAAVLVPRPHPGPRGAARQRADAARAGSSTASSRSAGAASARTWRHYRVAYGLLAGLATPLVLSVHSDRVAATSRSACLPGWHSTIFPPFFVAGAIFSGFAMVLTLVIPARAAVPARRT